MKYTKPDFDVTIYEVEDVITASFVDKDPDSGTGDDLGWGDF